MKIRVCDIESFGYKADGTPTGCQIELAFTPDNEDKEIELHITKKVYENKTELSKAISWAEDQINNGFGRVNECLV